MTGFVLNDHGFKLDSAKWWAENSFYEMAQEARTPRMRDIFTSEAAITTQVQAAMALIEKDYIPALAQAGTMDDVLNATSQFLDRSRREFDKPTAMLISYYLQGIIEYCNYHVDGFPEAYMDWQDAQSAAAPPRVERDPKHP